MCDQDSNRNKANDENKPCPKCEKAREEERTEESFTFETLAKVIDLQERRARLTKQTAIVAIIRGPGSRSGGCC
jgi:predicted nucleic-acid-binding Zn-ribbon protein